MDKHMQQLLVFRRADPYHSIEPRDGQSHRDVLEEILQAKRTALAEALLKTAVERWSSTDSLLSMAKSCKEAAGWIYPELDPEPVEEGPAVLDLPENEDLKGSTGGSIDQAPFGDAAGEYGGTISRELDERLRKGGL